ncbi:hypothetical protein Q669_29375 [Labrenzia sp. C1B10]|uniref:DUF1441 family protein n=1 Tax=unclassified Labrenzia TaxID=2648686 RepID=UPI0003B80C87|nr:MULTISPECIES: DUF1441 family protein [unclassified Labrenzia]ERP95686.1 hypothetical protein Q669_29375 [Labrenzia sp. C1B10]ERS05752.1 hypothetical protein Q675_28940 [Labrenzia sp. C1B70]
MPGAARPTRPSAYVAKKKVSLRADDIENVVQGVSVPYLMRAFRMGRTTIEKKLRDLEPTRRGQHNTPLYDLREAAARLVNPKAALQDLLLTMKPDDMPEKLRESYWNAKLKQQRFEEKAADLWRTDKVIEVFSEVLQLMRTKLQLLPEEVERALGIDYQQVTKVREIVDDVQDSIYQEFMTFAQTGHTPNQLGEDQFAGAGDTFEEDDFEDDEFSDDTDFAPKFRRDHGDLI